MGRKRSDHNMKEKMLKWNRIDARASMAKSRHWQSEKPYLLAACREYRRMTEDGKETEG